MSQRPRFGENAECVENWCVASKSPSQNPRSVEKTATVRKGWSVTTSTSAASTTRTVGVDDSGCSNEFACIEEMCRPDSPQPCGEGFEPCQFDWMVCDPQLGVCLPPSCANGQRCPEGLMCEEELWCVPQEPERCRSARDCEDGQVCERGRCVEGGGGGLPERCEDDGDCQEDQVCRNGRCFDETIGEGCRGDGDCGDGLQCRDNRCVPVPPPGRCREAADCEVGQVCRRGQCQKAAERGALSR